MSLPILSSNTIQAMVTPWCTYRGQQAYDSTNLAPLLSMPKIQDITCDVVAGQRSDRAGWYNGVYQSKYKNEVYTFDTTLKNCSYYKFPTKYSHEQITYAFSVTQIVEENASGLWETSFRYSSNTSGSFYCYNAAVNTDTHVPNVGNSSICWSDDLFIYIFGAAEDNTSARNWYFYSVDKSSNVATMISSRTLFSSGTYYSHLRASKPYNGSIYGVASFGDTIYYIVRYNIATNNWLASNALNNPISVNRGKDVLTGQCFITSDEEGNPYLTIIDTQAPALYVHDVSDFTSSAIQTIQTIKNTSHYVQIDDENFLIGNGQSISKIQWNKSTKQWDVKSTFNIIPYDYFTLDIAGRLWIRGYNSIVRVLPGQGVNLTASFDEDIYQWQGENINTNLTLSILDQDGQPVTVDQKVRLSGNITFEDGSKVKSLSFDKQASLLVPVVITGVGDIDCMLEF